MQSKEFSLVALALRTAGLQLLTEDTLQDVTARAGALTLHARCVHKMADVFEQKYGRAFNRRGFMHEASIADTISAFGPRTRRVHCLREPYDVYIGRGRGGIWGNPFSHESESLAHFKVETRDEACDKHLAWLVAQGELMKQLPALEGRALGCFCEAHERCHGDNLIRLLSELKGRDVSVMKALVLVHADGTRTFAMLVPIEFNVQSWVRSRSASFALLQVTGIEEHSYS